MKQYEVILSGKVQKSIQSIPNIYLVKIHKNLSSLSLNPRPFGCIKLNATGNVYRIRVGVYRIVYTIEDEILTVRIIKIDHRSSVYN
ncbi:MAG: type II toxin-antitoxin system RelE/ParE family toxin [Prevotellaceae bacterium]|jgi:mRNA interferase RelE/StbE|nr:type II toxin-antitoxin system RelE/ParE family toxin [Prevotellaceae bacterium]